MLDYKSNFQTGNHVLDSFEFESGRVLENVNVEYFTSGIPKYDDDGNIINAMVYCPTLRGEHAILPQYHEVISKQDFDKDEYFFIRILPLGAPNSCSPSSTGLKYNFPSYTFKDRINFKKQFLAEKFNIHNVLGLVGEGVGGYEIFAWACEYPEDMELIIVLNSPFKTEGYRYIFAKCIESIIDSSDDFYSDGYSFSLSLASISIFRLLFSGFFPQKIFESLNNDELDVLMDDYVDNALFRDIYDFKYRNDCILEFDVEDKLGKIKAKSLILGTKGYLFFNPETDLIPLENLIEGSTVNLFEAGRETYYDEEDNSGMILEIVSFLRQFQ